MKKTLLTTTLLMTFACASAFAHHPAADMVDPETYAMIDENVADTPHADMSLDDMGADSGSMSAGAAMSMESAVDTDIAMEASESVDTIDVLDNVVSSLSE